MKEFCTCTNCSDSELGAKVNSGWAIQFMQFMENGNLHVVFMRDVPPAATPAPEVVVTVPSKPIVNRPLPTGSTMIGLDASSRSVPLTNNKPRPGDTRRVTVPVTDPVMRDAYERGQAVYNRVVAEGQAAMKEASNSFRPNFSQGV